MNLLTRNDTKQGSCRRMHVYILHNSFKMFITLTCNLESCCDIKGSKWKSSLAQFCLLVYFFFFIFFNGNSHNSQRVRVDRDHEVSR